MTNEVVFKTASILFLDVVGWSKLSAADIRAFVERALPKLGELVEKRKPSMVNTWGDAIVAVFDSATLCAETALELCEFFVKTRASGGVSPGLCARVGLHVGEVFSCTNPITRNADIFGHAVHTAARLEPVASAGYAFCTRDFARMLGEVAAEAPKAHLIGEISLAKGYGQQEVYVVTWPNAPSPPIAQFRAPPFVTPHAPSAPSTSATPSSTIPAWLKQLRRPVKALYDLIDNSNTDGSFTVVAATYSNFGEGVTLHMCQVWYREIMRRLHVLERWGVGILAALEGECASTEYVVADLDRWLPELTQIFEGLVIHVNGTPDSSGAFSAGARRSLTTAREYAAKQLDKIQDIYLAAYDAGQRPPTLNVPKLVGLG